MEGIVSKELLELDMVDILVPRSRLTWESWIMGLITKLLEATREPWIYRNLTMHGHGHVTGLMAMHNKECLQQEIEKQIKLGGEGLEEQDKWMLEVNLTDLNEISVEQEQYWLIAISTAYKMYHLR
jgi:hypothetical protein